MKTSQDKLFFLQQRQSSCRFLPAKNDPNIIKLIQPHSKYRFDCVENMHLQILHECTFITIFHSNVSSLIKWHPEKHLPSMSKFIDKGASRKASSIYVLFDHRDKELDRNDFMRNLSRFLIFNLSLGKIP